jgi:hypothetical protein
MVPAQQRLEALDLPRMGVGLRLKHERKLAGDGCGGNIPLERAAGAPLGVKLCRVKCIAGAPRALDLSQCRIGLPHQRVQILAIMRETRNSDGSADLELNGRVDDVTLREGGAEIGGHRIELGPAVLLRFHDQKLVRTETRRQVGVRARLPDPLRDPAEKLVSDLVPSRGVDGAEPVEIDVEDSHLLACSGRTIENPGELLGKKRAVAQAGQRIRECKVPDTLLRRPVLNGDRTQVRAAVDDALLQPARGACTAEIERKRSDDPVVVGFDGA